MGEMWGCSKGDLSLIVDLLQNLGSRQPSLKGGLDLSKAHLSNTLSGHRTNHSIGSNLSMGSVLDEAAMRELDQVKQ